MIYKGLNRTGEIETVKAHGGYDVAEVYGGINESNPIYYKSRTITGQAPLSYKALSKPLSDYLISGNTVQDGTPSPDMPVDVVGCGVRTENLWSNRGFSAAAITSNHTHNISNKYGTTLSTTEGDEVTITQSAYPTGNVSYQNGFFTIDVDFSKYAVGDVVTISFDYIVNEIHALSTQTVAYAGKNGNPIPVTLSSGDWRISGRFTAVITIIADMNPYVEVRLCGNSITVKNIMFNAGSASLPYEPYGYKLPPTVNGVEYPIYLGQVETTRRIKKLVLTGEEEWGLNTSGSLPFFYLQLSDIASIGTAVISTHFQSADVGQKTTEIGIGLASSVQLRVRPDDPTSYTLASWKGWLSTNQPTIWYVLAEPETAVVNEPLHKIGDYADTISMAQAGVTIPTVAGANTLTIDTAVQPSEISITGNIKEAST